MWSQHAPRKVVDGMVPATAQFVKTRPMRQATHKAESLSSYYGIA